jgi:hypothetical protein
MKYLLLIPVLLAACSQGKETKYELNLCDLQEEFFEIYTSQYRTKAYDTAEFLRFYWPLDSAIRATKDTTDSCYARAKNQWLGADKAYYIITEQKRGFIPKK